jgi:hypothetical protein
MMAIVGRSALAPISPGAGLKAGGSDDVRRWHVPALILGATLVCISALALATIPALTAPSTHPLAVRHGLQSHAVTRLPIGLAPAASASIGASEHSFWPVRHGASLLAQGGSIHSTFTTSGAALRVAQGTLGLSLTAVGRGQPVAPVAAVSPTGTANQVLYRHGSVTEFFRNGPAGLEQGFTLLKRPQAGTGSLVLAVSVRGSLIPKQVGSEIVFRTHSGTTALRYGQLSALDATGRRLPAHMHVRNGTLQLLIDDSHARYPLLIDPLIQQGGKLTPSEESGEGWFGADVALSSDGNTALIGAPKDNGDVGAAWVFTRTGETWTQQGKKLTGGGELGKAGFGYLVALSSDGNTALISGGGDHGGVGAAWVFTRTGETWTQQGVKLTGEEESGGGNFGWSVALSSDGNVAIMGGPIDNGVGAAWVFTRTGETWTQQGPKLTGSEEIGGGYFGFGVALSGNGNTALVGGYKDDGSVGAAWVFTRSGSTWTQQGPKLTGSEASGERRFGDDVALSLDGNTALIGGGYDDGVGAAWVLTRSGSTWTQQGPKLTGGEETGGGQFGDGVALSSDGNTALIGGPCDNTCIGAAWLFHRSGATWSQDGKKATGSGGIGEGYAGLGVALSSDGGTALVGGLLDNGARGAAWVFVSELASPTVVTGTASSITHTSARLNATVNPNGGTVSDCHFEYGTSTLYGSTVPCESLPGSGHGPVIVSALAASLNETTTYHFRIAATNLRGTSYGADQAFTTHPLPPTSFTGQASTVTPSSATLNASVNPNGAEVSDCHFEYGTSTFYGSSVPCESLPGSGDSPVAVSALVASLTEGTSYHFRIVATNPLGTAYGADHTLTTLASAPEFGTCVKVATGAGKYENGGCTKLGGAQKYEWYPAFGGARPLVKTHFTIKIKELTTVTLQPVKGSKVTCTSETGTGEYTAAKTVGGVLLTFTGCERLGDNCSTAEAAAGEVVTTPLEGVLGSTKLGETTIKNQIGLDLFPVGKTGAVMEFSCGTTPVSVRGSVIGVTAKNAMKLTSPLTYAASTKGKQKPESFVGEPKDVLEASFGEEPFEQIGLILKGIVTNEEKVEVNSVV